MQEVEGGEMQRRAGNIRHCAFAGVAGDFGRRERRTQKLRPCALESGVGKGSIAGNGGG
jgi:hypothetical protein